MTAPDRVLDGLAGAGRGAVLRAGGTDLQERLVRDRRRGRTLPPVVDVERSGALVELRRGDDGSLVVGAAVTVASLASADLVGGGWPALARAAAGLATPQVRAIATVAGDLLQATRCPYVRQLDRSCWRTGGQGCPARDGVHDRGVVIDLGPCVAPHPSTLAVALLAHEAELEVHGPTGDEPWTLAAVLGDGTSADRDHQLDGDEVVVRVRVPAGWDDERGAYVRAAGRVLAEWPLVEVVARAALDGDLVTEVAVAVGGVATVPLRLTEVEEVLRGQPVDAARVVTAAERAAARCRPLPQTGYKVPLLVGTVRTALEEVLGLPTDA